MVDNYNANKFETFNSTKAKTNVENFHKKRVAFLIINKQIYYLKNSEMSHIKWADGLGIGEEQFNTLTRGYALGENIVFYKGNFDYDQQVVADANKFAKKVKDDLKIKTAKVFAGLIIGKVGEIFPPKKFLFNL